MIWGEEKRKHTCLKRDIPRRIARTATWVLLLPPPVKASQMPETDGRKILRERGEELEQKMGTLKDNWVGNVEALRKEEEEEEEEKT